jgi:hypothetical protein
MDDDYDISNDPHLYCEDEQETRDSRFVLEMLPEPSSMFACSCGESLNLHITANYIVCGSCGKVTPQY